MGGGSGAALSFVARWIGGVITSYRDVGSGGGKRIWSCYPKIDTVRREAEMKYAFTSHLSLKTKSPAGECRWVHCCMQQGDAGKA